jgi:hypothetical protein
MSQLRPSPVVVFILGIMLAIAVMMIVLSILDVL